MRKSEKFPKTWWSEGNWSQPPTSTAAMIRYHTPGLGERFDKSRFKFKICMYG